MNDTMSLLGGLTNQFGLNWVLPLVLAFTFGKSFSQDLSELYKKVNPAVVTLHVTTNEIVGAGSKKMIDLNFDNIRRRRDLLKK